MRPLLNGYLSDAWTHAQPCCDDLFWAHVHGMLDLWRYIISGTVLPQSGASTSWRQAQQPRLMPRRALSLACRRPWLPTPHASKDPTTQPLRKRQDNSPCCLAMARLFGECSRWPKSSNTRNAWTCSCTIPLQHRCRTHRSHHVRIRWRPEGLSHGQMIEHLHVRLWQGVGWQNDKRDKQQSKFGQDEEGGLGMMMMMMDRVVP